MLCCYEVLEEVNRAFKACVSPAEEEGTEAVVHVRPLLLAFERALGYAMPCHAMPCHMCHATPCPCYATPCYATKASPRTSAR
jgi:hypothetical protein